MKYVVITGISSGIGLYLAKLLSAKSYQVIGTYRNLQRLDADLLNHADIHLLQMDIADPASVETACKQIKRITGDHGLYALINNSGIAVAGPVTHLSLEKFRYQFEVNVFGLVHMIQLNFESLLKFGPGSRVINISSVSGLFASPFLGAYAASKFAVEGLSDSLRRELKLKGIHVVLIEPGTIRTPIWDKNRNVADEFTGSPFEQYMNRAGAIIDHMAKNGLPVEKLETSILNALESKNPKPRYLIRKNRLLFLFMAKYLPVPLVDFLVHRNLVAGKNKLRPV